MKIKQTIDILLLRKKTRNLVSIQSEILLHTLALLKGNYYNTANSRNLSEVLNNNTTTTTLV